MITKEHFTHIQLCKTDRMQVSWANNNRFPDLDKLLDYSIGASHSTLLPAPLQKFLFAPHTINILGAVGGVGANLTTMRVCLYRGETKW